MQRFSAQASHTSALGSVNVNSVYTTCTAWMLPHDLLCSGARATGSLCNVHPGRSPQTGELASMSQPGFVGFISSGDDGYAVVGALGTGGCTDPWVGTSQGVRHWVPVGGCGLSGLTNR